MTNDESLSPQDKARFKAITQEALHDINAVLRTMRRGVPRTEAQRRKALAIAERMQQRVLELKEMKTRYEGGGVT